MKFIIKMNEKLHYVLVYSLLHSLLSYLTISVFEPPSHHIKKLFLTSKLTRRKTAEWATHRGTGSSTSWAYKWINVESSTTLVRRNRRVKWGNPFRAFSGFLFSLHFPAFVFAPFQGFLSILFVQEISWNNDRLCAITSN